MTHPRRGTRSDLGWPVQVYQTSRTQGPHWHHPRDSGATTLAVQVGESLLIDFGRSLDVAYALDDGLMTSLPPNAFVDYASGCLGWKPTRLTDGPLSITVVAGARTMRITIDVTDRTGEGLAL